MKITIQERRNEALKAGHAAMSDRLDISFREWRDRLHSWDVKAFCDGDRVVGMLMTKGPELHVAVLPEVRGRWLSRRLIRETFAPFFRRYGYATTKVAEGNAVGDDFVSRIGFSKGDVRTLREGFACGRFDPGTAAGVMAGGSVLGGLFGADATKKAAQTQANASNYAANLQNEQFQQTQANLDPFRQAGTVALSQLQSQLPQLLQPFGMDQFQASPAYQFNLQQGTDAINKAAASRGAFYQPATLRDISSFSQGLASNEFQNAYNNYYGNINNVWNKLYGLVGTGQNAAAQQGGFGASAAQTIGGLATGGASAQAAGQIGTANALSGALGGVGNAALMNAILQQNNRSIIPGAAQAPAPGAISLSDPYNQYSLTY